MGDPEFIGPFSMGPEDLEGLLRHIQGQQQEHIVQHETAMLEAEERIQRIRSWIMNLGIEDLLTLKYMLEAISNNPDPQSTSEELSWYLGVTSGVITYRHDILGESSSVCSHDCHNEEVSEDE